MDSLTPSPAGSRRRSSGQRTPAAAGDSPSAGLAPPPSGPGVARSGSRNRAPAGQQSTWTGAAGGGPQYATPSPRPFLGAPHPQAAFPQAGFGTAQSPRPGYGHSPGPQGPSPGPQYLGAGQLVPRPPVPAGGGQMAYSPAPNSPVPPQGQGSFGPPAGTRKKRLVLACDGTWKSADSATLTGDAIIPSNVVHLTRAIKSVSRDGISQVVFYKAGVGTEGGVVSRIVGGATAKGLEDDILQGYYWLCQNYSPGDEIFLFGFSRGAFTSRSIAGMIDDIGLLTRDGIKFVNVVFRDFENRNNPNYQSEFPDIPFSRKPPASDPRYCQMLESKGLTRRNIQIKAIGVFDTVGSLGIPRIPVLERLGLQSRGTREYEFYDTSLGSHIEHAFQALALDEQRASFVPSVWEQSPGGRTDLRQVWFPGVHTNVGGGYADTNLSNISLAWMMAQLSHMLDFDEQYILEQAEHNARYYKKVVGEQPRGWSLGRLYNSLTGFWVFGGRRARTPGMYTRVTPQGAPTDAPLRQTNEYIHASARSRFVLDGTSYRDIGYYRPVGLESYRLRLTGTDAAPGRTVAVWESRRKTRNGPKKVLDEAPLFEMEKRLLGLSPRVEHVVLRPVQAEADMSAGRHPGISGDGPPPAGSGRPVTGGNPGMGAFRDDGYGPMSGAGGGGGGGGHYGNGRGEGGGGRRSRHSRHRSESTQPTFDEEKMASRASF